MWSGAVAAGFDLKPESGKSFSWGVVYDPEFAPGLSVSLDYWRLYLNDTITRADAQTVVDTCYNDDSHPFCEFINRRSDGQVDFIREPIVNLGRLDTQGYDLPSAIACRTRRGAAGASVWMPRTSTATTTTSIR